MMNQSIKSTESRFSSTDCTFSLKTKKKHFIYDLKIWVVLLMMKTFLTLRSEGRGDPSFYLDNKEIDP